MTIKLQSYTETKNHYIKMVIWRVFNALVFPLLPAYLRNKALWLFGANIGRSLVYRTVKVYAPWNLEIGEWSCIGPRVELYNKARISIGDNSVISQDSYICTASHNVSSISMALVTRPIDIQDNVWIAAKAAIMPGVTIAKGAVVAACSVVAKDVQPWTVVGGNPAKFIKERRLTAK